MTVISASKFAARDFCGVYAVENVETGHCYIGRSVRIGKRLAQHRNHLRRGVHCNPFLQGAFMQYGEGAFTFHPIMACSRETAPFYEALLIGAYRSDEPDRGYNLTVETDGRLCHNDETKSRISAALRLRVPYERTPEIREKTAAALRGRPGPNRGRKWPAEIRAKMGAPKGNKNRIGKSRSPEDRANLSEKLKAYFANNPEARLNCRRAQRMSVEVRRRRKEESKNG